MQATTLSEYLDNYGAALVDKLEQASDPLTRIGSRTIDLELDREPFDSQWQRVEAIVAAWNAGTQTAILSGATGTGKTIISQVAVHGHAKGGNYRCVVVCPSHLVKKWVRELKATIPGVKAQTINKYSDLCKLRRSGPSTGQEFYVMSDSKAKLGTSWEPSYTENRTGTIHCPDCNAMIMTSSRDNDGDSVKTPADVVDISKKQKFCEQCGAALWQWTRRFDRWPCADYIKKKMQGWFDYFIMDESHISKSKNSAIGTSVGAIARSVLGRGGHAIAMTGTIINGYADSLFPTLYRFNPGRMHAAGFKWDDGMNFMRRYGRIETVVTHEAKKSYRSNKMSKGRQTSRNVRPKPGIVPSLYGDCLMDSTVFMSLEDLGFDLPDQSEILHRIEMDGEMLGNYRTIESTLKDALKDMMRSGSKAAISIMLHTLLGWPDHPRDFGEIGYKDSEGEWQHVLDVPDLDESVTREKESMLISIIRDQVDRGRQSWVYTTMSQKRDVQARLRDLLVAEGIDARVLKAQKVSPKDREEWIHQNRDMDVMITHPKCVATGLDSFGPGFNFCSLIWYGLSYELDIVRQASGRAKRVGQEKECEVHYLYYGGTMQERCANLMSEKTRAAQSIDGNFSSDGLAGLAGGDDNAQMMLVRTLIDRRAA